MNIAVDVDEVLAELVRPINAFYNEMFQTNFRFEDYHSYDFEDVWGGSKRRAVGVVNKFFKSPAFTNINPIEDSVIYLPLMSRRNHFISITSRPEFVRDETLRWLSLHFRTHIDEVVFTGQYSKQAKSQDKSEICLSRGVDVIIEDNIDIARKCAERGITPYLLDKPWNRNGHSEHPLIKRVQSWKQLSDNLS